MSQNGKNIMSERRPSKKTKRRGCKPVSAKTWKEREVTQNVKIILSVINFRLSTSVFLIILDTKIIIQSRCHCH
jgi:hypothetical protein